MRFCVAEPVLPKQLAAGVGQVDVAGAGGAAGFHDEGAELVFHGVGVVDPLQVDRWGVFIAGERFDGADVR